MTTTLLLVAVAIMGLVFWVSTRRRALPKSVPPKTLTPDKPPATFEAEVEAAAATMPATVGEVKSELVEQSKLPEEVAEAVAEELVVTGEATYTSPAGLPVQVRMEPSGIISEVVYLPSIISPEKVERIMAAEVCERIDGRIKSQRNLLQKCREQAGTMMIYGMFPSYCPHRSLPITREQLSANMAAISREITRLQGESSACWTGFKEMTFEEGEAVVTMRLPKEPGAFIS